MMTQLQGFFSRKIFAIDGLTFTVLGLAAIILIAYLLFFRK
jgi:hypothetical protein